jgi:hypothetical protein
MTPAFIYALVSTRDNLPRYVGQSWYVEGRRRAHFKSKSRKGKLAEWERAEREAGFSIETRTLEQCEGKDAADVQECYWISKLKSKGYDLFNSTTGNSKITTPAVTP